VNGEHKITFHDFTERVAKRANVSSVEADAYIHQLAKTTGDALESGGDVQLYRFGRFHTLHVDERSGHNPQNGEELTIPDHTRVDFNPYNALLIAVNWPFRHLRTRVLAEDKTESRSNARLWILLALALLILIALGIGLKTWMSNRNTTATSPAALPAKVESERRIPAPAPIVIAPVAEMVIDAPAEPVAPAQATTRDIIVVAGDTLWEIAASEWEDSSWWPVIYAENRADMPDRNPDLIEIRITLRIPVLAGSINQPTDADLRQKANAYQIVANDYLQLRNPRAEEYKKIAGRGFLR
jgi:nucleoid DNA-binding protein